MYMEPEQKEFLSAVKHHTAVFFVAFFVLYIVAAFVSWEWKMKAWWWSVRLLMLILPGYISFTYAPKFYKTNKEEEEYYVTP